MGEGVSGEIGVVEALVAEGVIGAGDEQDERGDGREGGKRQGWGILPLESSVRPTLPRKSGALKVGHPTALWAEQGR